MSVPLLLRGVVIGLSIAAPVGPIGVLCMRQTLESGARAGLLAGLGAATADAVYGALAAAGLTSISTAVSEHETACRLAAAAILLYLGVRTALAEPAREAYTAGPSHGLVKAYGSTFLLTLANPMTIVSFAGILVGFGAAGSLREGALLVSGVFLGSALWWLGLSGVVARLRGRVTPARMRLVNRLSGAVLAGFGLLAALR